MNKEVEGLDPEPEWMNDLKIKVFQKIKVKDSLTTSTTVPSFYNYYDKFNSYLVSIVNDVFVTKGGLFFDQLELQHTPKGSDT